MKKITLLILCCLVFTFAQAQILSEDFEGSFPPSGWIDIAGSGTDAGNLWAQTTERSNSPSNAAFFDDFNDPNDRWLISPPLNLSATTNPVLSYFENVDFAGFAVTHDVVYSTDYSGSGDPTVATWTTVNDVIGLEDTWVSNGPFSLPVNSTVYVAFHYIGNFASGWYIDDILVQELPTAPNCVETPISPLDSAVDVVIFGGAVDLTWTAPSTGPTPDAYNVYFGETPGSLTNVGTVTGTLFNVTGLDFNTAYYWQIVPLNGGVEATGCPEYSFTTQVAPPPPNCAEMPISPTDTASDVIAFGGEYTFTWTPPSTGTPAAGYIFFIGTDPGALVNLGVTPDPFFSVINLQNGVTYYWQIIPTNGSLESTGCAVYSFTTEANPAPPVNNDCANALELTIGAIFSDNPILTTNQGATGSGELPNPSCSTYDPLDPSSLGGDQWFWALVPPDGNLTIATDSNPPIPSGDTGMSIYTGNCGSLVEFECDDDDGVDLFSLVEIESADGLAGEIVYIRVFEFAGDSPLAFQVSAYSATLSTQNLNSEAAFTYYPIPVKNTLTLNAQNNIETVRMYNMLGQEVMNAQPQTVDSELDMSRLETGTYFVQVTIANVTKTVRVIKQ
ncbi:choice-of-anchor J domain-containing protein [Winogradskyella sp. A2]|uniref:choice-of-anchor J domain-containing protein n=1 Tax=Winogradskyella sp. A2 TaxID=3366944 RepID=UPI00398C693C